MKYKRTRGGYSLIELIVAVGLFALIMTLASGAYLLMIGINRQAQSIATGINNLSFALETMTRTIRTGTNYSCSLTPHTDCLGGGATFYATDANGNPVTYALSGGSITQNGTVLTDPSVVINILTFYTSGTVAGDGGQPHVTIKVQGTVSSGPGKTEAFTVETGATMRGSDI